LTLLFLFDLLHCNKFNYKDYLQLHKHFLLRRSISRGATSTTARAGSLQRTATIAGAVSF
jgi:hypothetical protein